MRETLSKISVVLMLVALVMPNPALALRPSTPTQSTGLEEIGKALGQPATAGMEEDNPDTQVVRFETTESLIAYLTKQQTKRIPHPERAGGTHFKTYLYPGISLVEKLPNSEAVMASVKLAQEKLGGLTTRFTVHEGQAAERIFLESVLSLAIALNEKVSSGDMGGAKNLLRKFFDTTLKIIRRGVLNWDSKVENYGITPSGEVVLLDLGGLVAAEDALQEEDNEESSVAFFYSKMGEGVPPKLTTYFHELQEEYGFGNGSAIAKTIEANMDSETPQAIAWKPEIKVGTAGLEETPTASMARAEKITAAQIQTRYTIGQTTLPSENAFVITAAQVASQIWFYYMHDTVEPGLARLMANQRDILPKGIELALVAAPASPDQLRRPGGLFVDRWLPKKYEQFVLPEIPVTLGEPFPSLPSLILWILRGAGGEILEVKGVLKLEDNVFAYFV